MTTDGESLFPHLEVFHEFLNKDETVLPPSPHTDGDLRDILGYEIYPIRDNDGNEGDSVFLDMPRAGDCVEAVELVSDRILSIQTVRGEGQLIVWSPASNEVLICDMTSETERRIILMQGDQYAYINTGSGPFTVRDDCIPEFQPSEEIPATNGKLLGALSIWSERFLVQPDQGSISAL